jgi:RsiW-degrading membrane proteinase PrsW (M82 family)
MDSLALTLADGDWRFGVFCLEVILSLTLVVWLRLMGRGSPAPISLLAQLLGFGALAAMIAAAIEFKYAIPAHPNLSPWAGIFVNNVAASLIEELSKYFIAVLLLLHGGRLRRMTDAIFYLIVIGLGFSLVEDALFLINPETIAPYRLLSFYLHSGTSAIIGYNLGLYYFHRVGWPRLALGIAAAILLHLAYNLTTFLNDSALAFYLTVSLTFYISLQIFILYRRAVVEEFRFDHEQRPKTSTKLLNLPH